MKTKETLYTTMCNNIGQVRIENAQKEIERLNRQYNTNSWRTDNSPFMFVEDETDDDVHNPCELIEGYVWVTCEPKVQSTIELAADWFTSKSYLEQHSLSDKYFESRHPSLLTIEQVEEIWKNEVQVKELSNVYHNAEYLKPNQKQLNVTNCGNKNCQNGIINGINPKICKKCNPVNTKQFKQFNESLFQAYIEKFDDEGKMKFFKVLIDKLSNKDKVKALKILACEISATDFELNNLLNRISSYRKLE